MLLPGDDHELRPVVHTKPRARLLLHALDVHAPSADDETGVTASGNLDAHRLSLFLRDLDAGLLHQIIDTPSASLDDLGGAPQLDLLRDAVPLHHASGIRLRSLDGHAAVAHDPADVLALDVNLERVRGTLGRRLGQRAHVRGVQEGRDLGLGVTNGSRRPADHEERFVALAADAHARLLLDALDDLAAFADDEPAVLERARRVFLDKLGGVAGWAGWMPRRERSPAIVESAAAAGGRAAILVTVVTPAAIVPAVPVIEAAASAVAASVA